MRATHRELTPWLVVCAYDDVQEVLAESAEDAVEKFLKGWAHDVTVGSSQFVVVRPSHSRVFTLGLREVNLGGE